MCLRTNWKSPRTAKRDITVYKLVNIFVKGHYSLIRSPYNPFTYEDGIVYRAEMSDTGDKWFFDDLDVNYWVDKLPSKIIATGFHAATNRERINTYELICLPNRMIVEFIIPKGSLYYKDGNGLIVSNQIMLK